MLMIQKNDVTACGNKLVTEASTIGLTPGEWPDFVAVVDEKDSGFLFGPCFQQLEDGGRAYQSDANSVELHILND